jgi:hypothetical protein
MQSPPAIKDSRAMGRRREDGAIGASHAGSPVKVAFNVSTDLDHFGLIVPCDSDAA